MYGVSRLYNIVEIYHSGRKPLIWTCLVSSVCSSGMVGGQAVSCLSLLREENFSVRHYMHTVRLNFVIPAMLIGTIDIYYFVPLSLTLTFSDVMVFEQCRCMNRLLHEETRFLAATLDSFPHINLIVCMMLAVIVHFWCKFMHIVLFLYMLFVIK